MPAPITRKFKPAPTQREDEVTRTTVKALARSPRPAVSLERDDYAPAPSRIHVVAAGGRQHVLSRLNGPFATAYALVDRDTWTDSEVEIKETEYPTLFVTSGWSIENLFLEPRWLEQIHAGVAAHVAAQRERWVRAGALWWALQRVREAQLSRPLLLPRSRRRHRG